MCFLEILSKLFRLAIGELTEDRDIRREEKCKFESMLKAYLPGTIIAPCTSQWLRISTKSNTNCRFIYLCVWGGTHIHVHIYTKMHVTNGYDRRFVDERTVHDLPSLISVGSSPSIESKLILPQIKREREDEAFRLRAHSRIIASSRSSSWVTAGIRSLVVRWFSRSPASSSRSHRIEAAIVSHR